MLKTQQRRIIFLIAIAWTFLYALYQVGGLKLLSEYRRQGNMDEYIRPVLGEETELFFFFDFWSDIFTALGQWLGFGVLPLLVVSSILLLTVKDTKE